MSILFVFCLALSVSSTIEPPKCLITAPYNLHQLSTQLAVDKIVREAQAWYQYRLAWMAENLLLLPVSEQQAAIDYFMEVFCQIPHFRSFVGITGTGEQFSNRTAVSELYRGVFVSYGPGITFNVKMYNPIVKIDESLSTRQAVYANITAFNEHIINAGSDDLSLVNGHYVNQWRIDAEGYPCLSRFNDAFLKVFQIDHQTLLSQAWDLKI